MSAASLAVPNHPSRRMIAGVLAALLAFAGCGQKGPLTLPPAATASAPAR